MKKNKKYIWGEIILLLASICSVGQYRGLSYVIDLLSKEKVFSLIGAIFSIMCILGNALLVLLGRKILINCVSNEESSIRMSLIAQVSNVYTWRDKEKGTFFDCCVNGIRKMGDSLQWLYEKWPLILIQGLLALLYAFAVNWKLAALYLISFSMIGIINQRLERKMTDNLRQKLMIEGKHHDNVRNIIDHTNLITALGYEEQTRNDINAELEILYEHEWKIERQKMFCEVTRIVSNLIFMIIYYIYGGFCVQRGELTIGTLIASNLYSESIKSIINSYPVYMEKHSELVTHRERVESLLLMEKSVKCATDASEHDKYEIKDISYIREGRIILNHITLSIPRNSLVCIKGENGAGKSTLGKILGGLLTDYSGNLNYSRNEVQYIEQFPALVDTTILRNWQYGSVRQENETKCHIEGELYRQGWGNVKIDQWVEDDRILIEGEDSVSGGEGKKISLIRGLLGNKELLILDEPTEGLDKKEKKNIIQAIQNRQLTYFVISHDPDIEVIADYVYELCDGTVNEVRRPEE